VTAERGLLAALEGSCKGTIAGPARLVNGQIVLKGLVANLAGTVMLTDEVTGSATKARELGLALGQELIRRGAGKILGEIGQDGSSR
jgi:hydroxymethylbilane synthase